MKSYYELKQIGIKILFYGNLITIISCNAIKIQDINKVDKVQKVVLGSIGNSTDILFKNHFKITALANYKGQIRVSVTPVVFSKSSYKLFLKSKKHQMVNVSPKVNDSLKPPPKFVNIQITDLVSLIDELNRNYNKTVKNYLGLHPKSSLVTSISLALPQVDIAKIAEAEAVFLVQNKLKVYELKLHKDKEAVQTIRFNQGIVFAYKSSRSCWQEDESHQLTIVDLVEESYGCPPKTYKYADRAIKEIDYFKF